MTVITTIDNYGQGEYSDAPYASVVVFGSVGCQALMKITRRQYIGAQALMKITRKTYSGFQALMKITRSVYYGAQARIVKVKHTGWQALAAIYNTTNLRILTKFPSRGVASGVGNNAWGNPIGSGLTWQANSTAAGDFQAKNLNTDVVEQVWRSTGLASLVLQCDTEVSQGIAMDTFCLLNHNMTSSALVTLVGSNTPTFSTVGFFTQLNVIPFDRDIYWIAPELPLNQFRYWRVDISDSTNPVGFIQIGAILFGAAEILHGECFVDEHEFELQDFSDTVNTEGFTNVANSRAQKKLLNLEFRTLDSAKRNFRILRRIFLEQRTVLKAVYIPTPSPTDQAFMQRFALFGKLRKVPSEKHNSKGPKSNYASFNLEVDESK